MEWKKQNWCGDRVDMHVAHTERHVLFVSRTSEYSQSRWKYIVRRRHHPTVSFTSRDAYHTKAAAQKAAEEYTATL